MSTQKAKDMAGAKFGKLSVLSRAGNDRGGAALWACVCECGERRVIAGTALRDGRHRSCGCASPRFTRERSTTHGRSGTRLHGIWRGMKNRCSPTAKAKSRALYYERGIRVCDRWQSFEAFAADMGEPPSRRHSIDRIDVDGHYEPGNCRWATAKEQGNNKRDNCVIEHAGERLTVAQWAERIGVKANTITCRLVRGWPADRALAPTWAKSVSRDRKEARQRACMCCGALFIPRPAQLRAGHGKFCSQACNGASRARANANQTETA